MRIKELPSLSYLLETFTYNADTGELRWKVAPGNRVKAGSIAGSPDMKGHIQVKIKGTFFMAHRIVWFMSYGEDPKDHQVDHINRECGDNRLSNLRLATHSENICNGRVGTRNSSGVKGVSFVPNRKVWIGRVKVNHKMHWTKACKTLEEAESVTIELRERLHKQFACH